MNAPLQQIEKALRKGKLIIGIFGLGWMGLPTACLFVEEGARVIGVDIDPGVVERINAGKSHISEAEIQPILSKHLGENLSVTTDVRKAAAQSDIIMIIVPTSIDDGKKPDYSNIRKVCKDVGVVINKGCIVIIESTVGPGITETVAGKIIETNSGLKAGTEFGLAYSPIRAMAGRVMKDVPKYPRIVGGIDQRSLNVASLVLRTITKAEVIKVRNLKTAETVKLFENIYRDVNIALATELALFCEKNELDFMEVRKAAITQPYCHLHIARVGVGGHCIPDNPYFIISEADSLCLNLRLLKYARKVNDKMPSHIVNLVVKGIKKCNKKLKKAKIAVLGITYRSDVKEVANSPPREIVNTLMSKGATVKVYDPFYSVTEMVEMGFNGAESIKGAVIDADCILVTAGHKQFKKMNIGNIARLVKKPACIVDGWRVFDEEEVIANDLTYYSVGLG